jgi:hypothetical protein
MYNFFAPKPGRFGIAPVALTVRPTFGTLAAGTVPHNIGAYPRRARITGITISSRTFPTAATSVVATLQKKPVGSAAINLTSGINISAQAAETAVAATLLSTLTAAQLTLNPSETLILSVVTTGAVSVQPVDLIVTVELAVLE